MKLHRLLVIPQAEATLSSQGICLKCTSDFVIHSKTACTHTHRCRETLNVHTFWNSFKARLSFSHTCRRTHTHAEAITANTLTLKVCPMHELSKWLSQLQQTKLFSYKLPFSPAVEWKRPACQSTSQLLSVHLCLTAHHQPGPGLRLSVTSLWAGWMPNDAQRRQARSSVFREFISCDRRMCHITKREL